MWDDPYDDGPRYGADQVGDERDIRRRHDWSDIDAPADEPGERHLHVVGPCDDATEVEAPEAVPDGHSGGYWRKAAPGPWEFVPSQPETPLSPLEVVRTYLRRLRDAARDRVEDTERRASRPPWEK